MTFVYSCDTFLHFLADNLGSIPVHAIRRDVNNPSNELLRNNAVNIQFLTVTPGVALSTWAASIDILHDDENTCRDWLNSVFVLLSSAYYTPMFDYTVPTSPVVVGSNIMWDRDRVVFKRIISETYVHYSCTLQIKFHA